MTLSEILLTSGGGLVLLLTLIQISPLRIDPWSALARSIGKMINSEVLREISDVRTRLDNHIKIDNERNADDRRTRILRFNNELVRDLPHTREEFFDILADIDSYEAYCKDHPEYKNNRATHAIANIGRVYDERLKKHDFLK